MRLVTGLAMVAILSLLGGCVSFSEPVADDPSQPVDLSMFMGRWRPDSMPGMTVDVEQPSDQDSNVLRATYRAADGRPMYGEMVATISLSYVEGRIVASVRSEADDKWGVAAVEVGEDGSTLTLRWLEDAILLEAARSGELEVRQPLSSHASEDPMALIDVDGAALRDYLSTHVEVLDLGTETKLDRFDPNDAASAINQSFMPTAVRGNIPPSDGIGREAMPRPWDPNRSGTNANTMAYPYPGMPGFQAQPQSPFGAQNWNPQGSGAPAGADSSATSDADTPGSLKGMSSALAFLIVLGLVVGAALNYLRRYQRRRSPEDAEVAAAEEAEFADRSEDGTARPDGLGTLLRRYLLPALLILAVALGPILYVAMMLHGLSFSSWTLGLQPGAWGMLRGFAPYLIVLSMGMVIAIAEVVTTFPAFAAEALATRWAVLLVLFNGLGSMTVYSVIMTYASNFDHPLLRALAIAVGFAVLIRSRFVLARDLRAPAAANGAGTPVREGVSIDLGWLYARIQQLCCQRIEGDLLRIPRYATARLLNIFPDIVSLQRAAGDSIAWGDPAKSAERHARLAAVATEDVAPGIVRARLGRFIAQTGGVAHTRFLLEHGGPERAT